MSVAFKRFLPSSSSSFSRRASRNCSLRIPHSYLHAHTHPRTHHLHLHLHLRPLSTSLRLSASSDLENPPRGQDPQTPSRAPPAPPPQEDDNLRAPSSESASFLGTTKRLPEFNLTDKVVLVSGAARGLGLTQAEALLEAGATVYALDRLAEPSPDFARVQKRAAEELGTTFYYRQIDVRDVDGLNEVVKTIGDTHGRLDGLVAAAGIQQEVPALDYTAKDANTMFEVNITGVFMTAQAVAKQMIRFGNGGSMAFIASMSATIANRVRLSLPFPSFPSLLFFLTTLRQTRTRSLIPPFFGFAN